MDELRSMSAELWWHRYAGVCAHGTYTATTAGESTTHPEMLTTWSYVVDSLGCASEDCTTEMVYVRSWNHEPTEAESEATMPEEYAVGDVTAEWNGPLTPGVR